MSIAPLPSTTNNPLNRADLASFLPSPRTIKAYELLQSDSSNSVGKINEIIDQSNKVEAAPVLVTAASDAFDAESVLSASQGINLSLAPGSAALTLTSTGVIAGTYGSSSKIAGFTVDAKGRLTDAEEFELNSDNVTEGSVNLFFTQERARASISAGTGIDYNAVTGVISAHPAGAYGAPTGILSRSAFAGYVSPSISNPPTQAEVQDIADALQATTRLLAALVTDLRANGNLT